MAEDRIAALRQRMKHTGDSTTEAAAPTSRKPTQKSTRARHTLYLKKSLVAQLDQAYKNAAHDLYPQEIEKADYLEACLAFALAHQDEIKASLQHSPHV